MKNAKTISTISALMVVSSMCLMSPSEASASPATKNMPSVSEITNQEALSDLRSWIFSQPGSDQHYVGSVDDLQGRGMKIYWQGGASSLTRRIATEAQNRKISVTIESRKYSLPQINKAADEIMSASRNGVYKGFSVVSVVGFDPSYDGLVVRGSTTTKGKISPAAAMQATASAMESETGIPVSMENNWTANSAVGRSTDGTPLNAGGYMIGAGNKTCSSGFALEFNNQVHTTTARHCVETPYHARDLSSTLYGSTIATSSDGQANVLSGAGYQLAFDGPWNSSGNYKRVIGSQNVGINDLVCTGGGNSGENCNIAVTRMAVYWDDGWGTSSNIEGTQRSAGQIAAIQGDSGGPVISLASTSSGQVRAVGMIQAVENGHYDNCGSVHDGGNLCSDKVLFTSIVTIANSLGASLVTG